LAEAGAELLAFDPLTDRVLPPRVDGLVVGGGFPEAYAQALAENRPLLEDVRARVGAGLVTWAECGGLMWLARPLPGLPLAGGPALAEACVARAGRTTLTPPQATDSRCESGAVAPL